VLGFRALWKLYVGHLRARPVHELFALVGIAIGVALVFAVQVANSSIAGSVDRLVGGITGEAALEVAARDARGFDERVGAAIERVPGVEVAAPLLEQRVTLHGPEGERIVQLVGTTFELAALDGPATRGFGRHGVRLTNALLLPRPIAAAIGGRPDEFVTILTRGVERRVPVGITLGREQIDTLTDSPIAVAPLAYVQQLTGRENRLTRVLVKPEGGQTEAVREQLTKQFGGLLNVRPSDSEARLIRQAAGPNDQSTNLFAGISAIVGLLFAVNAMLLTVPERRRLIALMRAQGFSARQIGSMLVFEALMLGLAASAVGLVLGDLLSRWAFHSVPGYLSFAFPVGGQRIVSATTVALAVGAGLVGSLLAVAQPFVDVYGLRSREIAGPSVPPTATAQRAGIAGAVAGCVLVLATVLVVIVAPSAAILGMIALVAGMLLVLPALLRLLIAAAWTLAARLQLGRGAGERVGGPFLVAVGTLRVTATRGSALASTVAIAVFGSVAIMGAHRDLLRGLDHASYGLTHSSDVWIAPGGDQNTLTTMDFKASAADLDALRRAEGVAGVRTYQGTFLDYGDRRVWVIGRPAQDRITIPEGQVLDGDPERAARLIRAGGWAAISDQVAEQQGIEVGEAFELPAPTGPARLRLAARLTNVGWAPGTVILNQRDFEQAWGTSDPSAIEIDAAPGLSDRETAALVRDALGATTLSVETAAQRWGVLRRNARQGLNRLTQIATLVIVGAIFATAAAMSATLWQRRGALADLRMQGFGRDQVWTSLLSETALVLGCGCAIGAAFGLGGQLLLTRWLNLATGFPADYAPAFGLAAGTFALVGLVALAVISIAGYLTVRTPLYQFAEE
jgi:putative ABC transport system permease protein